MSTDLRTFRKMMKHTYKSMHGYERRITHSELLTLCQDLYPSETCTSYTSPSFLPQLPLTVLTVSSCSTFWGSATRVLHVPTWYIHTEQNFPEKTEASEPRWEQCPVHPSRNGRSACDGREPFPRVYAQWIAHVWESQTTGILPNFCRHIPRAIEEWNGLAFLLRVFHPAHKFLSPTR